MKLKGKEFLAVVATPAIGKSYLADIYKEFVDVDELRLFSKYIIPDNITREELELTKGNRNFEKRENFNELFYSKLDEVIKQKKILLCAPHQEIKEYLFKNKIPYLFVYPKKNLKNHIKERMLTRQNNSKFINENDELFYFYYMSNKHEPYAVVKYKIKKNEYLLDVLKKAGLDFNLLTRRQDNKEI
ncbi:MAG: hypothetical protein IJW82_01800 [Clostridia bacterium]|nr:hypothetical protein [Clostridia bacterium]